MEQLDAQRRTTFARFVANRLVGRLRTFGVMLLCSLIVAFLLADLTWVDILAHGVVLTMAILVILLPRPVLENISAPVVLALSTGAVGYTLLLYPTNHPTRIGLTTFLILAISAGTPISGWMRTSQCSVWLCIVLMYNLASGIPLTAANQSIGIIAAILTGWALGWLNVSTWRETWEDREILTHVSDQLARQSRTLQDAVEQTRDELKSKHQLMVDQERLATLGRLAVGIGHEINNPLTVAMTNVDLARTEPDAELLDDAGIALRRIRDIVQDLSRVARTDEPQEIKVHRLDQVLEKAIATARMGLKSTLHIIVEPVPNIAVRVNHRRLVQVLVNLLINAWHAMEERGHGTVQISIKEGFGVGDIIIEITGHGAAAFFQIFF